MKCVYVCSWILISIKLYLNSDTPSYRTLSHTRCIRYECRNVPTWSCSCMGSTNSQFSRKYMCSKSWLGFLFDIFIYKRYSEYFSLDKLITKHTTMMGSNIPTHRTLKTTHTYKTTSIQIGRVTVSVTRHGDRRIQNGDNMRDGHVLHTYTNL